MKPWLGGLMLAWASALPAPAQTDVPLQSDLQRVVDASGLTAGVAVIDVASGWRAEVNGEERFTMMSVYKLPIAMAVLRRSAQGRLNLDSTVLLRPDDRRPGPGRPPLADRIPSSGLRMTIRGVLESMLVESDNTACDFLLRLIGPREVTLETALAGGRGIRIDRQEGQMALDFAGATLPTGQSPTPDAVAAARRRVPAAERGRAEARFPLDHRDTALPMGMAELLTAFSRGRSLPAEQAALLRAMMVRTATGPNRLRAGLPADIGLAHRTGSAGGTGTMAAVNDVGLIAIPGQGDVAVAVFVRSAPEEAAERLIAEVARAVLRRYDRRPAPHRQ